MGSIEYKCEFGVVHSTANCRCMSVHVSTRQVKCDMPKLHGNLDHVESVLKSLNDRLGETIDGFFGSAIMPIVKQSLVDRLEQDVSEWLVDAATKLVKE